MNRQISSLSLLVSISSANQEYSPVANFPKKYDSPLQVLRAAPKKYRNPVKWINILYEEFSSLLKDFDSEVDSLVDRLNKRDLTENIGEAITKVENNHNKLSILSTYSDKMLEKLNNPVVLFMAQKHFIISDIILNSMDRDKEEIRKEIENRTEKELKEEILKNKDVFKLGIFVALEKVFINLLLIADMRSDIEFMGNYSRLIDRYSHMVARRFPEKYKEKSFLERPRVRT